MSGPKHRCLDNVGRWNNGVTIDKGTLEFYDQNSDEYAEFAEQNTPHEKLEQFIGDMPENARALDLGCGIGWAAAQMKQAGIRIDAMDASTGLAEQAAKRFDLTVQIAGFTTLSGRQRYDGIWSHFALQHAPRNERQTIFERISNALKPGGLFYAGMQKGSVDWRDDHGRLYCPFTENDLEDLLSGFADIRIEQASGKNFDGTPTLNLYVWARTHVR